MCVTVYVHVLFTHYRFINHIQAVLSDPPPWDHHHQYTPSTVQVHLRAVKQQEGIQQCKSPTAKCSVTKNSHTQMFTRVNGYGWVLLKEPEALLEVIISKNSNTLHFAIYTTCMPSCAVQKFLLVTASL